jgi:hypothetical protein
LALSKLPAAIISAFVKLCEYIAAQVTVRLFATLYLAEPDEPAPAATQVHKEKDMTKRLLSAVGVCLASAIGVGSAQTSDLIKVTLPFAVTIGTVTLPAGECTIRDLQDHGGAAVLLIRSSSGASVEALVSKVSAPKDLASSSVTFRQTGSKYEMDKIWAAGESFGYQLSLRQITE